MALHQPKEVKSEAREGVDSFEEVNRQLWHLPVTGSDHRSGEPDWAAVLSSVLGGNKSPEEQSNIIGRYFLKWLDPYITLASRESLEVAYMPSPMRAHHAAYCGAQLSRAFREEEVHNGRDAWRTRVEAVLPVRDGGGDDLTDAGGSGGIDHGCECGDAHFVVPNELARVGFRGEVGVHGRLRWVGYLRSSDTPHALLGGVEWDRDSVLPEYRKRLLGDNSAGLVHDGCVHGERLFHQAHAGPARCTCEYIRDLVPHLPCGAVDTACPRKPRTPSLLRVLLRTHRSELLSLLTPSLVTMICELSMPPLLQQFVFFLKSDRREEGPGKGLFFFLVFVIVQLTLPAFFTKEMQRARRLSALFRTATLAALCEKCLTVSPDALSRPDMSAGRVLTMASTDIENIAEFCLQLKCLWMAPIMLAVNVCYLFYLVGSSALAAVAVFLVFTLPVQGGLTGSIGGIQASMTSFTDTRLRRTNELLSGIRAVKTMGWESRLISAIEYDARSNELICRRQLQARQVGMWACVFSTPTLMIAAVLSAYTLRGNELDASVVLPLIAMISGITYPIMMLPEAFTSIAKFIVSTDRITQFLECDDAHIVVEHAERVSKDKRSAAASSKISEIPVDASVVGKKVVVSVSVPLPPYEPQHPSVRRFLRRVLCAVLRRRAPVELQWVRAAVSPAKESGEVVRMPSPVDQNGGSAVVGTGSSEGSSEMCDVRYAMVDKTLLHDVRVMFPSGQLTAVVGATGSGKSSLLALLLGTLRFDGHVAVTGPVAYVPQQPWIMQDTVEANISFFEGERRGSASGMPGGGDSDQHGGFDRSASLALSPLRTTPPPDARSWSCIHRSGGVRERIERAMKCCQIDTDVAQMPHGLQTEIGERGINLSGGQKARLSLARAVYADSNLILLDDPLSALDAHVGRRVMEEVLLQALAGKTRVLVTHQLQVLPHADQVVVMHEGRIVFAGSYTSYEASKWKGYMENAEATAAVGAAIHKNSVHVNDNPADGASSGVKAKQYAGDPVDFLVAGGLPMRGSQAEVDPVMDGGSRDTSIMEMGEKRETTTDAETSVKRHQRSSGHDRHAQNKYVEETNFASSYDADNVQTSAANQCQMEGFSSREEDADPTNIGDLMVTEEKETGQIPWDVYSSYLRAGGGISVAVQITVQYLIAEIISTGSSIWLTLWSVKYFSTSLTTIEQLSIYLGLVFAAMFIVPLNDLCIFHFARRASRRLHATLLYKVTSATLMFFDRTPLGRIINRFSKDIYVMDDELPSNLIPFFGISGYTLTSLAVTVFTFPLSIFAVLLAAYVFFCSPLLNFYTTIVREVRRRGSVVQSPLFSLLEEILQGRETIRAYKKSHVLFAEVLQRLNMVYSCTYVEKIVQLWLSLRIEYVAALVAITVGLVGILEKLLSSSPVMPEARVGLVSLSLTMCLDLSWCLSSILELAASIEASMNSIQRVCHYIDSVPQEALLLKPQDVFVAHSMTAYEGIHVDSYSVSNGATDIRVVSAEKEETTAERREGAGRDNVDSELGALRLEHVDMRYRPGLPLVLRDMHLSITPGQKVGVVGRTGSGKSTLLLALLRLVEICSGRILVCGRDARGYALPDLRRLFSMIPQDPVLFDGTVRSNLDPFGESSDDDVRGALKSVGLLGMTGSNSSISPSAATSDGIADDILTLETVVQEGGANFSVGQRQLLCLARALLKKGCAFILMDEATANVDARLCQTVQRVVAEQFSAYTVLTIAHRLHTVVAYDIIVVMANGRVVEMGSPRELLSQRGSVFCGMVVQSASAGVSNTQASPENAKTAATRFSPRGEGTGGDDSGEVSSQQHVNAVIESLLRQCT